MSEKVIFETQLKQFVNGLDEHISTPDGQWTVKGFVDVFKNVYSISSDTKIVSKILEIHLFPRVMQFADKHGYRVVLPEHQNYYPDISFLSVQDESVRFAVDFKTTYRKSGRPHLCIGSINNIQDIINGNGMFSRLGESWFDDYWMNYGKIVITDDSGKTSRITKLADFVRYRNGDPSLIVSKRNRAARTMA